MINELYHYGTPRHSGRYPYGSGARPFQRQPELSEEEKFKMQSIDRKSKLIKKQLGQTVDKRRLNIPDPDNSKSLSLEKGKKVYHVTPNDFKSLRDGQDLFISATDKDRDMYRAYLTLMMKKKGFGVDTPIKEVEFTLKEDLKSPSNDEQRAIFNELYAQNKAQIDKDLNDYYTNPSKRPGDTYDAFVKSLDSKGNVSKSMFYQAMKDNGYNAILDQHDVTGSWMQAQRPLILMSAMDSVGDMKVSDISDADITESLKRLNVID